MSVKIETTGKTISDALTAFGANLKAASTEELIAEVRQRLVRQKPVMVVKIVPFAAPSEKRKAA